MNKSSSFNLQASIIITKQQDVNIPLTSNWQVPSGLRRPKNVSGGTWVLRSIAVIQILNNQLSSLIKYFAFERSFLLLNRHLTEGDGFPPKVQRKAIFPPSSLVCSAGDNIICGANIDFPGLQVVPASLLVRVLPGLLYPFSFLFFRIFLVVPWDFERPSFPLVPSYHVVLLPLLDQGIRGACRTTSSPESFSLALEGKAPWGRGCLQVRPFHLTYSTWVA